MVNNCVLSPTGTHGGVPPCCKSFCYIKAPVMQVFSVKMDNKDKIQKRNVEPSVTRSTF